ncbi:MAG: hypothetical protein HKP06_08100 [Flavobacteriaceae bacterium]|nr:hypothetical protein [Flavobacteriaceae bacterium]
MQRDYRVTCVPFTQEKDGSFVNKLPMDLYEGDQVALEEIYIPKFFDKTTSIYAQIEMHTPWAIAWKEWTKIWEIICQVEHYKLSLFPEHGIAGLEGYDRELGWLTVDFKPIFSNPKTPLTLSQIADEMNILLIPAIETQWPSLKGNKKNIPQFKVDKKTGKIFFLVEDLLLKDDVYNLLHRETKHHEFPPGVERIEHTKRTFHAYDFWAEENLVALLRIFGTTLLHFNHLVYKHVRSPRFFHMRLEEILIYEGRNLDEMEHSLKSISIRHIGGEINSVKDATITTTRWILDGQNISAGGINNLLTELSARVEDVNITYKNNNIFIHSGKDVKLHLSPTLSTYLHGIHDLFTWTHIPPKATTISTKLNLPSINEQMFVVTDMIKHQVIGAHKTLPLLRCVWHNNDEGGIKSFKDPILLPVDSSASNRSFRIKITNASWPYDSVMFPFDLPYFQLLIRKRI